MSDAAERCNVWIGLAPNSNTKATPRKQGVLGVNKGLKPLEQAFC